VFDWVEISDIGTKMTTLTDDETYHDRPSVGLPVLRAGMAAG